MLCGRNHPCLRGEKTVKKILPNPILESPLLARGKGLNGVNQKAYTGITPACAGKSFRRLPHPSALEDHPRLRGEKSCWLLAIREMLGSPPLARGKGVTTVTLCVTARITPACAGKSAYAEQERYKKQDHPRLRGEKTPGSK